VVAQPPTTTGEQVHIVAAGDNLFRIGLRYGFTVAELAAYNGIANPHYIYVGQAIRIPPGGNQ
jgi:LysM repeat protein